MLKLAKWLLMAVVLVAVSFFFADEEYDITGSDTDSYYGGGSYEGTELEAPEDTGDKDTTWTVLMYVCGSNLESENGMATQNFKELLAADFSDNVNYVVETGGSKRWSTSGIDTKHLNRFVVSDNKLVQKDQVSSASMGDPDTLTDFIKWGVKNYPADKYMLVFWDHGGGSLTGVCSDELYSDDMLTLPEISSALKSAGTKFNTIGFDTCLMASLEMAATISPYASYMVASEESEPGTGWDYTSWVSYLSKYPGASGVDLGTAICDSYYAKCKYWWVHDTATLSVIDLSEIKNVTAAFQLATDQMVDLTTDVSRFRAFTIGAERAENYGGNTRYDGYTDMVDLGDLMDNTESLLTSTASHVNEAVAAAVKYNVHGAKRSEATGLSVFYPLYINQKIYNTYAQITDNTSYLQFLAVMSGQYSSYFRSGKAVTAEDIANAEEIDPVQEDDINIQFDQKLNEDGYLELTVTNGLEYVKQVGFSLAYYDETSKQFVYLGSDNNLDGSYDEGVFTDRFGGEWMTIGGKLVSAILIEKTDEYNLYSIPAKVNGKETSIRAVYEFETDTYRILGTFTGYDEETGTSAKAIERLDEGDEVTFLFYALGDEEGEDTKLIEMDTVKWTDNIVMNDSALPDGEYYYMFEVTDLFGNISYADPATMTCKGEDIEVAL